MYDVEADVIQALRSTSVVLPILVRAVPARTASTGPTASGEWSMVEILCHLRDSEETALERTRSMRDQDGPQIAGYDQEARARERNYAGELADRALSAFLAYRRQHVDDLERLERSDWSRFGQHSEYGRITILDHAQHVVAHDLNHLAQLAALA